MFLGAKQSKISVEVITPQNLPVYSNLVLAVKFMSL